MAHVIDRQEAHDLIDQMTPEPVRAEVKLLKSVLPLPIDDEPVTEGHRQAILRSEAWFREHGGQIRDLVRVQISALQPR
jgi:hypothetical protein